VILEKEYGHFADLLSVVDETFRLTAPGETAKIVFPVQKNRPGTSFDGFRRLSAQESAPQGVDSDLPQGRSRPEATVASNR
jgi:hypothetical protein